MIRLQFSLVCFFTMLFSITVVNADGQGLIHLNEMAISNNFVYDEKVNNLSMELVESSFSLFYLDDTNKQDVEPRHGEDTASGYRRSQDAVGLLTLNDLLDIAFAKNRLIEVVRQQQLQGRGQLIQARSGYLPHLSLEGRYSYTERENSEESGEPVNNDTEPSSNPEDFEGDDVVSGAVKISQLIYDFGKTTAAMRMSKRNLLAANAKLHRQIQEIVFKVKDAYYTVLEKKRLIAVAEESVKSFEQHQQRASLYYKAGVRTRIDVINAEVELSNARMNLVEAKYALKSARVALEQILGVRPHGGEYVLYQDEINFDKVLETMPPIPEKLEKIIDTAIESRPDLVQLNLLTQTAKAGLKMARGDYWPSVSAEASYNNYDTDLSLYKDSWEVGMVASWDLFSGLHTRGATAEAHAKFLENRALLEDQRLIVVREVTERYLEALKNRERVKIALETLERAKENLFLAEKRYESGANDVIEYNDAQLSLTETRTDLVVTYYGYLSALAGIELASGRFLP